MADNRYLVISDLQIPFEHLKALSFCIYLKKHYKIPDENIICIGDEVDQYFGSFFDRDPDALHSPQTELTQSIDTIKKWQDAFPKMKLCVSNHGIRWQKKAFKSGIPSQMMRRYEDVLQFPDTWILKDHWIIQDKHPFRAEHGDLFGSRVPHIMAANHYNMSTIIGHHHSKCGTEFITRDNRRIWGAVCGSMIDFPSYAFKYAKYSKDHPCIGTHIIVNSGALPIWIPLE